MGKIMFNDQDITHLASHQRVMAGIAYAPEDSRLFPELTVEENIQLGFWITNKTERSGSFDLVKAFSEAMENIKKDLGVSILLAESNVRNASQVAERAYIIDRGEIIFEGDPSGILEDEQLLKLVGK
jgi:ABC-type branched-subunit amino acid transport system ATPase component